jgi:DNA-binding SARP family transcriptional activator
VLIEGLLAQGNPAEAERIFVEFSGLLARKLGVKPSRQLMLLIATCRREPVNRVADFASAALLR